MAEEQEAVVEVRGLESRVRLYDVSAGLKLRKGII